jgi:peptide/nickel transport system substrate-binding protein
VKIDIRWQLLLVVICLGLVVSLLSYQTQGAELCTTRVPSTGGRLGIGIVGRPDKINPLLGSQNPVDNELINLVFDGLLRRDEDGAPLPALAESWTVSGDGKTLNLVLRDDISWHDGRAVTSKDVMFTYGLIQDEDFPAPEYLKSLWSSVVISSTNETSVELTLPQPYGPFLDALTIGILPAHLLGNIPPDQIENHPFNRAPIGTGPFAVSQVFDWEQTGLLRLIPAPQYWQGAVKIDTLDYHFYPDYASLAGAFSTGNVQAVAGLSSEAVPDFLVLPGFRLFTSPNRQITQLLFNIRDNASPLLKSEVGRKALSAGTNRPLLIDEAVDGQGVVIDGPFVPGDWAFDLDAIEGIGFNPAETSRILDELGWLPAEGGTGRERDGEPLVLTMVYPDDTSNRRIAEALDDQWAQIGIEAALVAVAPDEMSETLSNGTFDVAIVDVLTPVDPDLYDFWSQEAIINGQNYGGWNNRLASEALESGRQLYETVERIPYYSSFLRAFNEDLPAFALFRHVENFAVSETIRDAEVGLFQQPRERFETLTDWVMLYREIAVACPESEL